MSPRSCLLAAVAVLACAYTAQALVVGIDVGSEYIKVALVKPGTPFEIVHNTNSKRKTEDMVAFYNGQRLYAGDAVNLATRKPHLVFSGIRELLGRNLTHPTVTELVAARRPAFNIVEAAGARGTLAVQAGTGKGESGEKPVYSVEEVMAMVLTYIRGIASDTAGSKIRDVVLTVPMYFTQNERQALIDAAELAGLKVLSLVEDNTAAAIQYGIYRVVENQTQHTLIYNMGSTGTQVSIVASTSYKGRDRGVKKDIGLSTVVGKGWDATLGGAAFTDRALDLLVKVVNEKHMNGGDIRSYVRPMAKLRKGAHKTKEVLSANEEFVLFIESLTPEIDFRTIVARAEFEAASSDLLDRVTGPIASALAAAKLSLEDIDEVEVIGGGVRIPAVQARLKALFGEKLPLGVHLNGDESMALGASFLAANRSKAFSVRKVGMVDTFPFAIGVRLAELPGYVDTSVDEEGNPVKPWHKRSALFRKYNHLQSVKKITLPHTRDFQLKLQYENDEQLPAGTPTVIVQANVTGLTEAAEKVAHLGVPKVSMSFKLDRNGIVRVQRAEATIEEIIPPAPEEEEEQAAAGDDEAAAGRVLEEGEGEAQGEGTAANDAEGNDKAAEGGDKAAEGDDKAAEGDDKAAEGDDKAAEGGDKTADAKDSEAKPAKKKAKKDNKPTKKVHRFPLTITLDKEALAIKPLEGDTLLDAKARLQQLDAIDDERKQREEAKNGLESFAYTTRDKFEEYEEQIEAVTTSEQREAVSEKLSETTEWLYDEGEDATFDEYQARRTQLELLITPIMSRVAEAEVRDTVVADAFEALDGVAPLMEKWAKEKPQVNETEREAVITKAAGIRAWLEEKIEAQKAQEQHLAPAFTRASVQAKLKTLQDRLRRLSRRKPLPPPPPPSADKEKATDAGSDSTDDAKAEGTAEEAAAAAEQAEAAADAADAEDAARAAEEAEGSEEGEEGSSGSEDSDAAAEESEDDTASEDASVEDDESEL